MAYLVDVDCVNDRVLVGPGLTCTRAGANAMRRNSSGYWESVAANTIRHHHDKDGNPLGYLPEDAATNVLLYSNDTSNAAWAKTRVSVTPAAGISPSGANDAQKLIPSTDNNTHILIQGAWDLSATGAYSFWFKAAGYDHVAVAFDSIAATSVWFDLTNGTPGTQTAIAPGSIARVRMIDEGDGWWRCDVSGTRDTAASLVFYIGNTGENSSFAGNGTDGVLYWTGQIVQNETAFTSPIITAGAAETRALDVIDWDDASWAPQDFQGSYYLDLYGSNRAGLGGTKDPGAFNQRGPSPNHLIGTLNSASAVRIYLGTGSLTFNPLDEFERARVAVRIEASNIEGYSGGDLVQGPVTDNTWTPPTPAAATGVWFGRAALSGTTAWGAPIRRIIVADDLWDAATLQSYATNGPPSGGPARRLNIIHQLRHH